MCIKLLLLLVAILEGNVVLHVLLLHLFGVIVICLLVLLLLLHLLKLHCVFDSQILAFNVLLFDFNLLLLLLD